MTHKTYFKTPPIRLTGKAKTEFRKRVAERAGEICEKCGVFAPRLWNGAFNLLWCGHVSHIRSYGAGGGDEMDEDNNNVEWLCCACHREKHGGV